MAPPVSAKAPPPVADPKATPAVAAAASPANPTHSPRPTHLTMEVCGVGEVQLKLPPTGQRGEPEDSAPHLFQHPQEAAWAQVLATLEAEPAEAGRAAGLVLQASGALLGLPGLAGADAQGATRRLAALAAQSTDPAVLQWAWLLCQRFGAAPECQAVSPQALVRTAPDDGRSWMILAAHDPAARAQAVKQAARAPRYGPVPSLLPWVDAALPSGMAPYLRVNVLLTALGAELTAPGDDLLFLVQHCRQEPAARQECLALAETLVSRGDLLHMTLGSRVGERLGWPAERVAALKREADALTAAFAMPPPERMYSCEESARTTAWLRDRAALGERAALRRRVIPALSARVAAPAPATASR